jgi:flagellar basal-body rod modification protein FlgD
MTPISGIEPTTSTHDSAVNSVDEILGKDDFLNLLIAQLQNQDPLNPTEGTEFTAQLAQFSSLEQLSNINGNLENMELFQASMTNSQAVSYIGKEITARGNSIQLTQDQPVPCNFELEADAEIAVISIYDSAGGFLSMFETGPLTAGRQTGVWDGTDSNGNRLPDGIYSFEVQAADADNQGVDVTPLISAVVTGVSFKDNKANLVTELQTIAIEDVMDVSEADPQPAAGSTIAATNSIEQPNGGK